MWHPGGAHPFAGLNEALVHNGDFANYHSVCEYLRQRNIRQQFLTDTEVSVQLFDLWDRVYQYPLEYIIEALAPTTELDFDQLPPEKQAIYRQIQATHIHASPDGPWFFIIARNHRKTQFQLLGITDTAMLRPQVFALSDSGEVQIGLICSEKQAIDATLRSLAKEDPRFCPVADKYWNARGGSPAPMAARSSSPSRPARTAASGSPARISSAARWQLDGGAVRCDLGSFEAHGNGTLRRREGNAAARATWRASSSTRCGLASWPAGQLRQFCQSLVHGAGQPQVPRHRPRSCSRCCTTAASTPATSAAPP